jgi:hypothetical protein
MMHSIFRYARVLALMGAAFCVHAHATPDVVEATTEALDEVVPSEYNGDVRDLPPVYTPRPYLMLNEFEAPRYRKQVGSVTESAPQAPNAALAAMPSPTKNFAGLGFSTSVTGGQAGGGWPPDTNGDVGPTYYIQSVNTAFGIFNKSTGTQVAAFTENQLWNGASTSQCSTRNQGDPVVLHDAINDRWILTDFAFTVDSSGNSSGPFYQCIAVSKSGDPVGGGWWLYAIRMDAGNVPTNTLADYPKFGLWGDGCLYMGANGFDNSTGNYAGAIFASFNTANMYSGAALTSSIGFLADTSVFSMFPANLLGTTPSGTAEYFVNVSGTTFAWDVRKFTKGTNCGGSGTLGTATQVSQATYGYPGTGTGSAFTTDIVEQAGAGSPPLDSLGDRIMQKVQYRKIGTAESLWVVHTTCGSAHDSNFNCVSATSPTQLQWTQINVTGGTINATPVQQQIYAPDTTKSRWMPSLAVDASGDMAMGYSYSSSTDFPGIRYAGRLIGDTLNQLPQTEVQLVAGLSSQKSCSDGGGAGCTTSRWGDYSSMSVDPSDDCTFWYTNEYYSTASNNGEWQTRIGAFKFPTCVSAPPATKLAFTQQPSASYASGATITVKVSVETATGAVATSDTSAVTIALTGGTSGAVLGGTKTINAVAGVATFSLTVDKVGTAYKLHATDGTLTAADSSTFNITAGAAKTVTFTTQPSASSNVVAGVTIPLVAHVVDAAGNAVSGQAIALAFGNNPGASTLSVTANPVTSNSSGDASFANVSLNKVANGYTLTATDNTTPAATHATSNAFNIIAAAPFSIAFINAPSSGQNFAAGSVIPLVAQVKDRFSNTIGGDSVTIALAANPGSATLSVAANPVVTNSSGVAGFNSVSLNKAATGYTFMATEAAGALSVAGNAFNIVAGAAAKLVFTTQPTNVAQGGTLNTIAVTEQDSFSNTVASDNSTSVGFTVSACGGTAIGNAVMSGGVASLSSASVFNTLRPGLKVTATGGGHSVVSQAFNVGPSDLIFVDGYEVCAL